jgi:hypothetical protein
MGSESRESLFVKIEDSPVGIFQGKIDLFNLLSAEKSIFRDARILFYSFQAEAVQVAPAVIPCNKGLYQLH